jgi:hypothetical protein
VVIRKTIGVIQLIVNQSPASKAVSTEAEKPPLLEAVVRERLMKTQQAGKRLSGCCGNL